MKFNSPVIPGGFIPDPGALQSGVSCAGRSSTYWGVEGIQAVVEDTLRETVEKFDAIRGWAIVQRVKTGELLALAT